MRFYDAADYPFQVTYGPNPAPNVIGQRVLGHWMNIIFLAYVQFCYTGTAIQTLWMVLHEAVRRKDKGLFNLAAERIKRHIEVSWDDVYGGAFRSLIHIDENRWGLDKVLWLQEEFLIGALCVIEHTGAQWAKDWFAKMFVYMQEKFPGKQYDGCPIWILYTDRKVTFDPNATYICNFHHPRHLAINLSTLHRMIGNGGKISTIFA